jgi:hypothetical protein
VRASRSTVGPYVGRTIGLRDALASDPAPLRAPPAWMNSELGTVNGLSVLHEGILIAAGERHRAAVLDDCLLFSVEGVGMQRTDG